MKKTVIAALIALALGSSGEPFGAPVRFEKVSDHCYYLQLESGENIAAVVTDDGVVVVDPPSEPDLSLMIDALKPLSSKKVRWVVFTDPRAVRSAGARFFAEQGALLIGSARLRALSPSDTGASAKAMTVPGGSFGDVPSYPWLVFEHQLHLFPSNLELKLMALNQRATTGGDVVLYIPAERVLILGSLYEAASYPGIDSVALGNASNWVDGVQQVVDWIPVLRPAIPPKSATTLPASLGPKPASEQAKVDSRPEPEVTLEEGITVVSARGEASNLQNVKDLLSACQKLRTDVTRMVKSGRSCANFLRSSRANIYRVYGNFNDYAAALCEAIASSPLK